jgi:hypothetical protein
MQQSTPRVQHSTLLAPTDKTESPVVIKLYLWATHNVAFNTITNEITCSLIPKKKITHTQQYNDVSSNSYTNIYLKHYYKYCLGYLCERKDNTLQRKAKGHRNHISHSPLHPHY